PFLGMQAPVSLHPDGHADPQPVYHRVSPSVSPPSSIAGGANSGAGTALAFEPVPAGKSKAEILLELNALIASRQRLLAMDDAANEVPLHGPQQQQQQQQHLHHHHHHPHHPQDKLLPSPHHHNHQPPVHHHQHQHQHQQHQQTQSPVRYHPYAGHSSPLPSPHSPAPHQQQPSHLHPHPSRSSIAVSQLLLTQPPSADTSSLAHAGISARRLPSVRSLMDLAEAPGGNRASSGVASASPHLLAPPQQHVHAHTHRSPQPSPPQPPQLLARPPPLSVPADAHDALGGLMTLASAAQEARAPGGGGGDGGDSFGPSTGR
ncbi:hypothetical protein HK405_014086, partial [Cladochytrium tenue]